MTDSSTPHGDALGATLRDPLGPTADWLEALELPPETPCWRIWTPQPIAKAHPRTRYLVTPPTGPSQLLGWNEHHPAVFDGYQYAVFGVLCHEQQAHGWYWANDSGTLLLEVRGLVIHHPAWQFRAVFTIFPEGPTTLLQGLSAELPDAEWKCARKAWRILRAFRQVQTKPAEPPEEAWQRLLNAGRRACERRGIYPEQLTHPDFAFEMNRDGPAGGDGRVSDVLRRAGAPGPSKKLREVKRALEDERREKLKKLQVDAGDPC